MKKEFIIVDPVGLHARPATLLVNEASKFASESKILVADKEANLKKILKFIYKLKNINFL